MKYRTNSMRCLGIDPGLSNTGWAVVSRDRHGAFGIVDCGCITTDKKQSKPERVHQIYNHICEILQNLVPDLLAVERVFFNKNPSSCLSTAGVSYLCLLAAEQAGIRSLFFTPQQVKSAVGCSGSGSKSDVKLFVSQLTNTTIKNSHTADAAAAAIAGLLKMRVPSQTDKAV